MADGLGIALFRRMGKAGEEARALARLATEPGQQRAIEQFRRAVTRAPDIRAALRDPRVLEVLTRALGIPDAAGQPGLASRALLSDPADQKSLVNQLPDTRWKAAAQTLALNRRGLEALRDPAVQARLAEGLQRAAWNQELSRTSPGLGDAVLFREQAAGVKNVYEILGNPVLRRVVTTTLGLPQELALQSVEAQGRAITTRLDLGKLAKPAEVQRMAERYLALQPSTGVFGGAALPGLSLLA